MGLWQSFRVGRKILPAPTKAGKVVPARPLEQISKRYLPKPPPHWPAQVSAIVAVAALVGTSIGILLTQRQTRIQTALTREQLELTRRSVDISELAFRAASDPVITLT